MTATVPLFAYVARRALVGLPLAECLPLLPDGPFRKAGDRLDATPPADRQGVLDAFLDARDDGPAILDEMGHADPGGPPPDGAEDDHEGWEPARYGDLPEAPAFPLDVLPPVPRRLVEAIGRAVAAPPDFAALGVLLAASAAIGRSCSLKVKDGYFASASLNGAAVGGASSGKTPSLDFAVRPLWKVQERERATWESALGAWKERSARADFDEAKDPRPRLVRLATSNPTTEALGPILRDNPRGMVVLPDEMSGWVSSMDQYKGGKGGDRSFYLSAWSGAPIYIDRAKNNQEPIPVPHPFLSVGGGMVPSSLPGLAKGG